MSPCLRKPGMEARDFSRVRLHETKDLLGRAGYALSPSSRFDLIIEYFIRQEVYDTDTINLALFEHEQPLLGE